MLYDVLLGMVQMIDSPLPESIDKAGPVAFKREGAIAILEEVFEWEPQSVKDELAGGKHDA